MTTMRYCWGRTRVPMMTRTVVKTTISTCMSQMRNHLVFWSMLSHTQPVIASKLGKRKQAYAFVKAQRQQGAIFSKL